MIIEVKVIPKASRNAVKVDGTKLKAYVTAPPEDGKANKAVIDLLAAYYGVRKLSVRIVKGLRKPIKIVEVNG